jgi:dienelactone hydrolase
LGDYEKRRARELAEAGYVALAIDVYGKGVRPTSNDEAGKLAGSYKKNRPLLRQRVQAGLSTLQKMPQVDSKKIAAIGYCFGGTSVLELARSGATIGGVVSFHGNLDTPILAEPGQIKAKVLVLHGANDPFVPADQVLVFESEMRNANVDWQLAMYGGAVHGFSDTASGSDPKVGMAYDASADRRSWAAMMQFFKEIF